jgi:hypothetical protein
VEVVVARTGCGIVRFGDDGTSRRGHGAVIILTRNAAVWRCNSQPFLAMMVRRV